MPSRAKRTGFAPAPLVVTLAPITSIQVPTWEASLGGMDVRVATHNLRPVAFFWGSWWMDGHRESRDLPPQ